MYSHRVEGSGFDSYLRHVTVSWTLVCEVACSFPCPCPWPRALGPDPRHCWCGWWMLLTALGGGTAGWDKAETDFPSGHPGMCVFCNFLCVCVHSVCVCVFTVSVRRMAAVFLMRCPSSSDRGTCVCCLCTHLSPQITGWTMMSQQPGSEGRLWGSSTICHLLERGVFLNWS